MQKEKNGWGTVQMLVLCLGFLIALLVSMYFISELYGSLGNAISNKQYVDLENNLELAAKAYIDDQNININGEYKISLETLKKHNYINEFVDQNGNVCNGYVKILNVDDINHYSGFILCQDYQSLNY